MADLPNLFYVQLQEQCDGFTWVKVVRCKDCKYSEPSVYPQAVNCTVLSKAIREWTEGYGCPENKDTTCPATDLIMTVFEDHYCGWGERRENEKDTDTIRENL